MRYTHGNVNTLQLHPALLMDISLIIHYLIKIMGGIVLYTHETSIKMVKRGSKKSQFMPFSENF